MSQTHRCFVFILLLCSSISIEAQPLAVSSKFGQYETDRLSQAFHKGRRDSVCNSIPPHSAALFIASEIKNRANDVNYEYHQDPNFYYLTGHIQPHSALLLIKSPVQREILFIERKDPSRETWTGVRLGIEGAKESLGFSECYPIDSLSSILEAILPTIDSFYYQSSLLPSITESVTDTTISISKLSDQLIKDKYPNIKILSPAKILARLRMKKAPEEMVLLRRSIAISNEAHNEILQKSKPGWYEYQIQALGEYIFKKSGAEYTGYPCIVGSGNNSTILHYETNRRKTEDGDFIEMDIGSEYHGYSADITRSFPINGKFTTEQRAIYNLVLEAQDSGIAAATVGNAFKAPHLAAVSVIQRGLLQLGIIQKPEEYRKYFMHGTSHYLGLDVHDAGTYGPLEEDNVITVEPGIYIAEGSPCDKKWWKIGCRIEDDILITKQGPENLSIASPRTADDIEKMMDKQH